MLRKFLVFVCLFVVSCSSLDYKRAAYNSVAMIMFQSIDQKTKQADFVSGTAFAVDENYLVTAAHVCRAGVEDIILKNIENFSVFLIVMGKDENTAKIKDFKIVAVDEENDLCLIYKGSHGLKPVTLSSKEVKIRDSVFIVGAPASNFPIEAEGFVSSPHVDMYDDWKDRMILSLDIFGGNSGGPVFNADGSVVGIISAGSHRYLHLGIAVKSKYLIEFLKKYSDKQIRVNIKVR